MITYAFLAVLTALISGLLAGANTSVAIAFSGIMIVASAIIGGAYIIFGDAFIWGFDFACKFVGLGAIIKDQKQERYIFGVVQKFALGIFITTHIVIILALVL